MQIYMAFPIREIANSKIIKNSSLLKNLKIIYGHFYFYFNQFFPTMLKGNANRKNVIMYERVGSKDTK